MIRAFAKLVLSVALAFSVAAGAVAQSVKDHLGPLDATLGQNGDWTASLTGGWFLLTNRDNQGSIRYFSAEGPRLTSGVRTLKSTVIVLPHQGADAYGGILFDFAGGDGYYAFTIAGDGRVILWDRSPSGFKDQVAEGVRAKLDGSDVLEVRETPTETTFHINGQRVFTSTSQQGFYPAYGIVAIGAGRFGFDGFTADLQQGAGGGQLPPPGGDETVKLPPPGGGGTTGGGTTGTGGSTTQDPFAGASPEDLYRAKVVLGTTLGIFFHELGHAVIGETKLPATGPEEDVADAFSAFVLSSTVTEGELEGPMKEFFTDVVKYSSLLWYYQGKAMEAQGQVAPWQGEHAPDLKRFRNSFCIIYGSDPQRYEQLANKVQLGDRAKYRCQLEYEKRYNAWETILKTVSRNLGPDSPGDHPIDAPGGKINLTFVESNDPYGNVVEALLRDTGTMAEIAKGLEQMIVWPRDLSVEFRDCKETNAWYDPNAGQVVMCYSLIKATSEIVFTSEGQGGTGPQQGGGGGGQQAQGPAQFLLGLWKLQGAGQGVEVLAAFANDGSYQIQRSASGQVYNEVGKWQAQMAGQQIQLQQNPSQAQQCDQYNQCQPMQVQASTVMVQVQNQNTIMTEGTTWQRIQQTR